jgi:hypothetical protein
MGIYWYIANSKKFVSVLTYICDEHIICSIILKLGVINCSSNKCVGVETKGGTVPSGLWYTIYNHKVIAQPQLSELFVECIYSCIFHKYFFSHICLLLFFSIHVVIKLIL